MTSLVFNALSKEVGTPASPTAGSSAQAQSSTGKDGASVINWLPYPDALKKSRKENKHVFVHFTATWCGWCKKMERETYTDTTVIKMLNKNFVCSKVWGDTDTMFNIDGYQITQRALAQTQFGVRSYPTLWFISPTGAKVGPVPGYQAAAKLTKVLEFVRDYQYDTTRTQKNGQGGKSGK
jgi:thioredoxin-related protein